MNRLAQEKSAYLKHAADQKIDWRPWSEDAFELAGKEDKPLFLSSGGVWCHWCHVMAKECFYDDDIAEILNEHFISIKIDRDERPDIDRRYQMAVGAMGSGGGWPLSVFLTPDKKPFYGGTYFPPEDKLGKPGLKKVLHAVLNHYKSKRDEIDAYADNLINSLKPSPATHEELNESLLHSAAESILSEFDSQNGGFGSAPKFPMPGAIEFLTNRYVLTGDNSYSYIVRKTLESMARGGFHDHIGGGFHRYSTDRSWIIPHFEKMADDNAWLLRNYLCAYSVFGNNYFKDVAIGIIGFVRTVLSDPDGGFFSSQDADVTPDDEGGYFTWTREELGKILSRDELEVVSLHLFHDSGSMHHDTSKKVLFAAMSVNEIAEMKGRDVNEIIEIIETAKKKLLKARDSRETPFIDRTLYTSLNGMFISTFLLAHRVLKDDYLKDFAVRSLDRIIKSRFINNDLFHTDGIKAMLDDYAYIVNSLIAAYEVCGDSSYIDQAESIMGTCIDKLWDRSEGGFLDTEANILEVKVKNLEDIPHPSANSLCIILLLKLFSITGKEEYRGYAEKSLKVFSARADNTGIYSGYFFSALDAYFNPLKISVNASPASVLAEKARSLIAPHIHIVYGNDSGNIIPCSGNTCYEPIEKPEGLDVFLQQHGYYVG